MKTVAFVPVKLNSTRLKNKNILPFGVELNKKPLISYIFSILSQVKIIDSIYCYCSDESIKEYIPDNVKFLKRSKYLDGYNVKSNDLLYYFANDVIADKYVLTHATNPLILPQSISKVVKAVDGVNYDSAMTVQRIQDLVWIGGQPNFDPSSAPITQNIEPIYKETYGAICLMRDLIVNEHRRAGYKPAFIEVSEFEAIDINTEEDFQYAQYVYRYLQYDKKNL